MNLISLPLKFSNRLNSEPRAAKRRYVHGRLQRSNDSKQYWKIVNGVIQSSSNNTNGSIKQIRCGTNVVTGPEAMASVFRRYLIGPKLAASIVDDGVDGSRYNKPFWTVLAPFILNVSREEI